MLFQNLRKTKFASRKIATLSTELKNNLLLKIAENLDVCRKKILNANKLDLQNGQKNGLGTMLDRLLLNSERIDGIISDIQNVVKLEDQVGKKIDSTIRPNGLKIKRVRTPLGVTLMIYEARPNVTIDATVLALKSGNAVVLKGGSDAINTNRALVSIIHKSLRQMDLPEESVYFIDSAERSILGELLKAKNEIDVVIPRGGKGLINFVVENSLIPVIETGASVVHTYVDEFANLEQAVEIITNAKTRRVSVCNALDVVLVNSATAKDFLPLLIQKFKKLNLDKNVPMVEIRADKESFQVLENIDYCSLSNKENTRLDNNLGTLTPPNPLKGDYLKRAELEDFDTEFLDYILAIKIVKNLDEAIDHITEHSLKHSEAIITESADNAQKFLQEVDAACVYHNVSTAFSDGAQFGVGAEIGISTQKLHTRGPFALEGLTSFKWIIEGNGQIRD